MENNNSISQNNNKKTGYSCSSNCCCPTVEYDGDNVFIKDDFGSSVKMTKSQWEAIVKLSK